MIKKQSICNPLVGQEIFLDVASHRKWELKVSDDAKLLAEIQISKDGIFVIKKRGEFIKF